MYSKCEVTVLGGLPLTAVFAVARAEPDVGIFSDWIDDCWLEDSNGKSADWAMNKMKGNDWERVYEECMMSLVEEG